MAIDAVERKRFVHDVHQKRRTIIQPPGTSVVAVIDWYARGQQPQPWPWKVDTDGDRLIFTKERSNEKEIVELGGRNVPLARWTRFDGDAQAAAWQSQPHYKPLPPIEKAEARDGMVYVNGEPFLANGWNTGHLEHIALSPGGLVRWPKGRFLQAGKMMANGKDVDLLKMESAVETLDNAGKYAVLIIEPYWGRATPGQGQVSWRGEDRAGQGLNTNACWRNPDFIAERLDHVRHVARAVRSEPRAHRRILGYIVWNEQRWAWGDETCYCTHCKAAWAKWLPARYRAIDALNREYGTGYKAFDQVPLPMPVDGKPLATTTSDTGRPANLGPKRDVTNVPAWRDFRLFKADGLIQFEKLGAAAAKEADPERLVISSIFSRDVHPNIGHVMLRLYRELGSDPNIDVIGGNSYEVLPEVRSARHIAMWRSTPAAHAKPIWFTEFNDHGRPFEEAYSPETLNALLARTTFSGCSGLIWFTDLIKAKLNRLSVLEPDGVIAESYQRIKAAHDLMWRHRELIAETARSNLPDQVAIVHLDEWNALADNEYYDAASQAAHAALGMWCGFATRYLAEPEIREGQLRRYPVAVLWQAQRSADVSEEMLRALRDYVEQGGTLLCDMPLLQDDQGAGPPADWNAFFGLRFANGRAGHALDIDHPQFGRFHLAATGDAFPAMTEPQELGTWDVQPAKGAMVVPDANGRPAVVIHPVGRGRVITLCFRPVLVDPDPDNREMLAKLLRALLAEAGQAPLVDLPWLEKTIAPLADGGLLVTVFNPRREAVYTPMHLPYHPRPSITPIRIPVGAAVAADGITLPAGKWLVFTVR